MIHFETNKSSFHYRNRVPREKTLSLKKEKSSFFAQVFFPKLLPSKEKYDNLDLEEELEELEKRENEFLKTFGFVEFTHYREKVKEVMAELLKRAYRVEEFSSKKQKICQVVRVIDEKLKHLQQTLLHRRQDMVIALHLMGQIRGLIVDVLS